MNYPLRRLGSGFVAVMATFIAVVGTIGWYVGDAELSRPPVLLAISWVSAVVFAYQTVSAEKLLGDGGRADDTTPTEGRDQ
ncbi:hypothetical protein [Haloarchaeobius sp. DFWS5]|uniref:hypothetical protein n=1 Tax=Haloarchaeobius sp. DFWS5 TaxID=3446114 RepID=UPI003EBE7D1D